jgi:LuxR family maltose regulon positive regulatory protein
VDVLAAALTLACPQGYVRVFADEGPPMGALLGRLVAQKAEQGAAAAVPGLAEQLTARELDVLMLLPAGAPTRA